MRARHVIIFVAMLVLNIAARAQKPLEPPKKEDIICIVYEFELTSDGKTRDIKVSQIFWQKDRSDASGAVTDAEKERGAALISTHAYHPRPDQVGTKRYDFVLFDAKSRGFDRGARP